MGARRLVRSRLVAGSVYAPDSVRLNEGVLLAGRRCIADELGERDEQALHAVARRLHELTRQQGCKQTRQRRKAHRDGRNPHADAAGAGTPTRHQHNHSRRHTTAQRASTAARRGATADCMESPARAVALTATRAGAQRDGEDALQQGGARMGMLCGAATPAAGGRTAAPPGRRIVHPCWVPARHEPFWSARASRRRPSTTPRGG